MGAVGLSGLAAFSLTLTAVAPVGAVWLCTYYDQWHWKAPAAAAALVGSLLLLCYWLLSQSRKHLQRETLSLVSCHSQDTQLVGFVVAYAMPLIAGPPGQMVAPLVAFVIFLVLVVWRTQLVCVNPLASLLGYHFHRGQTDAGREYLLLSRRWHLPGRPIKAVRLSQTLFLDLSKEAE